MSETCHILQYKWNSFLGDYLCVIGLQYDRTCSLPIGLFPEEHGIAAVDRLYPLKPKNPI